MKTPNDYTVERIQMHLGLLKEHKKKFPCPDCMSKHLIYLEGYALEALQQTNDMKWLKFANKCRAERKALYKKD